MFCTVFLATQHTTGNSYDSNTTPADGYAWKLIVVSTRNRLLNYQIIDVGSQFSPIQSEH